MPDSLLFYISMGANVKDQCMLVRRRAWGRGYFSPQDSIFLTTCFVYIKPQEVKSNAVYCTQHSFVVIILYVYMYVYTCPTSVHLSFHDTYCTCVFEYES